MITVTLYYRPDCPACEQVEADLSALQNEFPHNLVRMNAQADPALEEAYGDRLPVVQVGPYRLRESITQQDLKAALGAARDRQEFLSKSDGQYRQRADRGKTITGTDKFTQWLSRHYMAVCNLLVFIYIGLPFLAPALMKEGVNFPAKAIYTIYSPLCHQFAFRSFFLFGEQPDYPRALANVPNVMTYEQVTNSNQVDLLAARKFIGNDLVGYKVALCERDVAIYLGILAFGLIFALTGRRIKSVPWYFWLLIGVVPIGVDGSSQLPALLNMPGLSWLPIRESTPFLRVLTGGLFGVMTAWYIYPIIEESMRETRNIMAHKIAVITQSRNSGQQ